MATASLPKLLREDNRRAQVEGETFSSNPAHPFWRVKVRFTTGLKPSTERIRAASGDQALDFVCARYPFADRRRCEVLGRWDAESAPIDHKAPVERSAPAPPMRQLVPAHTSKPPPPLQPTPASKPATMTKPVLGADLKRLPRDPQGRAKIDESVLSKAIAANDGGLSWPVIADTLGCNERNLRERAGKWRKRQEARQDAAQALQASVASKRQEGGPVPDGVPVAGADPGKEVFVPLEVPVPPDPAAQAVRQVREAFQEVFQKERGTSQGLDRDVVAAGWRKVREERKSTAAQQPPPEPEIESKDAPADSGLWFVHANGRMVAEGQPLELAERLVSILAGAGISCSRCPDEGVFGPRTASHRVAYSRGYDHGQRDARSDLATRLARLERPQLVRSDSMAAAYAKASEQPTPAPVINPTKAGGFTVQITVNPIESGG